MTEVRVRLPDGVYQAAGEFAREAGLTLDQLVASAVAEKLDAMAGSEWLAARAARGDRARFEDALGRVADVEPDDRDRW